MAGSTCQSCGEPLLWVENAKTGRRLPLVATPNRVRVTELKAGMVVVSPNRKVGKVLTLADIADLPETLAAAVEAGRVHMTHFADCSDAKQWVGTSRAKRRVEGQQAF